jgi:hypothetical protein
MLMKRTTFSFAVLGGLVLLAAAALTALRPGALSQTALAGMSAFQCFLMDAAYSPRSRRRGRRELFPHAD